jgi:hypothetical protein
MNKIITLLLILSIFSSCSSSTIIRTGMPDAKIFINDQYYGTESAVYTDMKVSFLTSKIKVEKEGCQTMSYVLTKNDRFDYMALLGGLLMVVPLVWIMKYRPVYHLNYTCG